MSRTSALGLKTQVICRALVELQVTLGSVAGLARDTEPEAIAEHGFHVMSGGTRANLQQ